MDGKLEKSNEGDGSSSTSSDSSDGEDQDEPSSSHKNEVEDVLANFREKWQRELRLSPKKHNQNVAKSKDPYQSEDHENNAKLLFLKGSEMERSGKLYEAIQYYRRAVQIVPDIELRIENVQNPKIRDRKISDDSDNEKTDEFSQILTDNSDEEDIEDGELLPRLQRKFTRGSSLCYPKFEQHGIHIGQIPVEIILYILRWVVSSDLDLRSLEMFSAVCRGFYLCARDPEIWRLACLKVWGLSCEPTPGIYESWRNMFIVKPRVIFNGCYISKTTYIRHGENSFQDQFYRPWHLVAYYRYLRFFPEGSVLMLTSAEDPIQCVGLMKTRNPRHPVLSGYYRLKDDKLTLIVQRQDVKVTYQGHKNRRRIDKQEHSEQTFHMEFQIKNHNRRRHVQLVWTHYSVFTKNKRGDESTCNFDLIANRFPPLWFSRVKSFTAETENILI